MKEMLGFRAEGVSRAGRPRPAAPPPRRDAALCLPGGGVKKTGHAGPVQFWEVSVALFAPLISGAKRDRYVDLPSSAQPVRSA